MQRVPPLDFKKSKKNSNLKKKSLIKYVHMDKSWYEATPNFIKNFNVYSQKDKITPEAGEKKAPF